MGKALLGAAVAAAFAFASPAQAFVVTGTLTGDIRPGNPDNLIVDVTVTTTSANTANWVIDINSPLHPNIKLDEFYFNLSRPAANYSFSNFDPTGWAVSTPATVQGAGGASFMFEALDPAGPPNADDVTNSQNLSFTMTTILPLLLSDFTAAPISFSNEAGSGQMGAHLQSLTAATGESDSGFAFGNYGGNGNPPPPPPPPGAPEPGTLLLLGAGLAGLGYLRRRK